MENGVANKPIPSKYAVFFKNLAILLVPATVVFLAVTSLFFHNEMIKQKNLLEFEHQAAIQQGVHAVVKDIKAITTNLFILSSHSAFKELYWQPGDFTIIRELARDFKIFAKHHGVFDQVRYISVDGKEVIRVNYNNGYPTAVPDRKLQDKSSRYYFKDAIKLNRKAVFLSPLDLNVENGKIEQPIKPMLRIGTPVFDPRNEKMGLLLFNYYGQHLLDNYAEAVAPIKKYAYLLNKEGYFLFNKDQDKNWGFMLGHNARFQDEHPDVWEIISKGKDGQFFLNEGLYTFKTVHPLEHTRISNEGLSIHKPYSDTQAAMDDYLWYAVSFLPREALYDIKARVLRSLSMIGGPLYALIVLGALWLARTITQRNIAQIALQNAQNDLERRVTERTEELSLEILVRKNLEQKLRELANTDELTEVLNRRGFMKAAEDEWQRSQRYNHPITFLSFDADYFKSINDNYGHAAGDEVLKNIAMIASHAIRDNDIVGRIGGEEFAIALIETNLEQATEMAERLRQKIEGTPTVYRGQTIPVTISIGISQSTSSHASAKDCLIDSDMALYRAKEGGRNRVAITQRD